MGILTREGRRSWSPSGVYFSRVNRVFVFSFSAFLLRENTGYFFAPCFNHFLSDFSSGRAISSGQMGVGGGLRRMSGLLRGRRRAYQRRFPAGPGGHGGKHVLNAKRRE